VKSVKRAWRDYLLKIGQISARRELCYLCACTIATTSWNAKVVIFDTHEREKRSAFKFLHSCRASTDRMPAQPSKIDSYSFVLCNENIRTETRDVKKGKLRQAHTRGQVRYCCTCNTKIKTRVPQINRLQITGNAEVFQTHAWLNRSHWGNGFTIWSEKSWTSR
jgi:hypothetical protein